MYNQKHHQFNTFYNHKFAFHITGPRQDAFDEVLRLRPKVVKTLDFSVDVMKNIKAEIPDLFLIGRLFVHPQDFGQLSGSTSQIARQRGRDPRKLREELEVEAQADIYQPAAPVAQNNPDPDPGEPPEDEENRGLKVIEGAK